MLKALRKKLKDQRGLTLIELLAVIVILGIIAAIAVPSIGGLISKTKEDAKVAEAIQIINAAKLSHASNANVTNWKHEAAPAVAANGNAVATPQYGGLNSLLENVKDTDYIVTYANGVYSITNHDASTGALITEAALISKSN